MARGPFYETGKYLCRITGQGLATAGTGTPQFVLRFKVIEKINGEDVPEQYERTIYRAITDKTVEYVVQDLKTLGYTRDGFRFLDPQTANFHSFIGQEFAAFCNHEKDQHGELREKWGIVTVRDSDFQIKKPLDSGQLRKLDMMFGKALKSAGAAAKPEPVATAAGVTDDDVPF